MTHTGTQNRAYHPTPLMVEATFYYQVDGKMVEDIHTFNWNDRAEVRNFATQSDRIIRMGGKTLLAALQGNPTEPPKTEPAP